MKKVRTIDILTKSETEQLMIYEQKILSAKHVLGVYIYIRRALRLLDQAKKRYLGNEEST